MTAAAEDLAWIADAVCATVDTDLFFPDMGGATKDARRVCQGCPVIDQCRDYAVAHPDLTGIWGGTTWIERKKLRAQMRAAA